MAPLHLPDDGGGVLSPKDQQPYGYLPPDHAAGRAAARRASAGRPEAALSCWRPLFLRRGPFYRLRTGVNLGTALCPKRAR